MADHSKPKQFDIEAFHAAVMESQGRLATAIGKFSMEFVVVERQANWAIAVFLQLKTNQISDLLFGAIRNFSTKLDILESLIAGMAMACVEETEIADHCRTIGARLRRRTAPDIRNGGAGRS